MQIHPGPLAPSNGSQVRVVELAQFEAGEPGDTVHDAWQVFARNRLILIVAALVGACAGLLYYASGTPVYQARALIELLPQEDDAGGLRAASPTEASWIDTEVAILQSRSLRSHVGDTLKATHPAKVLDGPSPLAQWAAGLGLRFRQPDATAAYQRVIDIAAATVRVRSAGQTRLVEILAECPDPAVAAAFANALVAEFVDQKIQSRLQSTRQANRWLSEQSEELKTRLETSENELQNYARAAGLLVAPDRGTLGIDKLQLLQAELAKAQADRVAKQSRLQLLASVAPDMLSQLANDATLRGHESQLADLRRQMAELASSFTPAHYRVRRLQAQISELESLIGKEQKALLARTRTEFEEAVRHEQLLNRDYRDQVSAVSDQARKGIHYSTLKREIEINQQLYETMLQRLKELGVKSAMQTSNVRIIDAAVPPHTPSHRDPVRTGALGLMAGLFLCAAFVLLRDRIDRRVRAPGELASFLKIPEFGVIPRASADPHMHLPRRTGAFSLVAADGGGPNTVELATWQHKPSILAESFRATLASMLLARHSGARPHVAIVSSPCPGEGKSTVVSNLGIALVEVSQRVLIIDADMRNPRLHEVFDTPNTWGLSDLLQQKTPIADCPLEALVRETRIPNLWLLPSGPPVVSISHLLFAPQMAELVARFRKEFDMILVDTPPLLAFSDARVLGQWCDGVVLVVRAKQSRRAAATEAIERLARDSTPVLGTVLNDWDPGDGGASASYYYRRNAPPRRG